MTHTTALRAQPDVIKAPQHSRPFARRIVSRSFLRFCRSIGLNSAFWDGTDPAQRGHHRSRSGLKQQQLSRAGVCT